ncbi:hypothetical protein PIB30_000420 [Stylosanthes scabra]|uniref:Kinesin-like protein n=1 Tax=Stylosanthes scabra TaxID=79078 RepID=A0ABU6V1L2_9FABA|nr:hypothetical protein [Stylosanthes scabra]
MAAAFPFSVISMVEDVLHKYGDRLSDNHLASRKAKEASSRRKKAVKWLRKMVGTVGGKELPCEPSEEEFMASLRNGVILCSALNKIQPGAVPKVVESPSDADLPSDGITLTVYQCFENMKNFLVAAERLGLPTFETSDLEPGGIFSRVVDCILAIKAYSQGNLVGKISLWRYGSGNNSRSSNHVKTPKESLSRAASTGDRYRANGDLAHDHCKADSMSSLSALVHEFIRDKNQEEIPELIESLLGKVMEEFEQRMLIQQEMQNKITQEDKPSSEARNLDLKASDDDEEEKQTFQLLKQQQLVELHKESIQELKDMFNQTKTGMEFLKKKHQEEIIHLSKQLHSVASAASGYQRVLEENRKLYNQVQDLKGNIRVYCRVRPCHQKQGSVSKIDEGSISLLVPSKNGKDGKKTFTFNRCFGPNSTQAEVFADTQPLIRSVLDGYNVCIFAYGQTGSGKTHTMSGPNNPDEETVGVNYRALRDLFLISEQRKDTIHYEIRVQMLEIYNETVRDLLSADDANLVPVQSTADVLSLMDLGFKNRAVSATAMNDRSSRSHSCLTVHVHGKDLTSGKTIRGSIHLVDLAGSERVDKSEVTGDRLKEAQHINKSLAALGDVISSLAQKQSHVPYRNSKLTQLLQDSLGGQAKTLMFVHIAPEQDAVVESISTLKFAERVSTIELGAAKVNKDSSDVKELKEQIASLKAALAQKDEESEQSQFATPLSSKSSGRKLPRDDSVSSLEV